MKMITQVDIAREVGVDVSSVNKILNRVRGPVFRKETIRKVFSVAHERGYNFNRAGKGAFRRILEDLFPYDVNEDELMYTRNVDVKTLKRIKRLLYGK
jgi:transcriptional regulator with XRE-family HTH domain